MQELKITFILDPYKKSVDISRGHKTNLLPHYFTAPRDLVLGSAIVELTSITTNLSNYIRIRRYNLEFFKKFMEKRKRGRKINDANSRKNERGGD